MPIEIDPIRRDAIVLALMKARLRFNAAETHMLTKPEENERRRAVMTVLDVVDPVLRALEIAFLTKDFTG